MSRDKNSHLRLAGRPADYRKLGIDPVEVAQFEDGQRIGTEKDRQELAMPPAVSVEMAKGFSFFMVKAVMSGRAGELIDLARTDLWR